MWILLLLLAGNTAAWAQTRPSAPVQESKENRQERVEDRKAQRNEKLGLSDDQSAKLDAINQSFREEAKAVHNKQKEQRKSELESLQQKRESAVKEILTADQFKLWKADQQKMKEQRKGKVRKHAREKPGKQ